MTDSVLISAGRHNFHEAIDLALEYELGVELMHFSFPDILDDSVHSLTAEIKPAVSKITGPISIHGPFYDMATGSVDERINELCRVRYTQALDAAADIGAQRMVVHANFLASIRNDFYRKGWHQRNVDFWGNFAEIARSYGVIVALENMWEFDPFILADLLREVDHPNLASCLDVGHAFIFSDEHFGFDDWVRTLQPWLIHTHLNNNNGRIDEHFGLDYENGALNYREILPLLRELPTPPQMVLEMDNIEDMRNSLIYFELSASQSGEAESV